MKEKQWKIYMASSSAGCRFAGYPGSGPGKSGLYELKQKGNELVSTP